MASSHASISRTLAAVLLLAAVATPRADGPATRRDAEQLKQKVAAIQSHAERGAKQPRRTTVTEIELNSYLAFDAKEQLPAGVVEPSITIVGTGRVSGRAVVDLDAVRKQKAPTSLLDPMNYLTGRLPVSATGVLTTSNGVGRFELESASISSLPIPKLFLQEIVSYYSRTADKPAGVSLDDPFALPSRIREIQVLRGQAIIVQ
ncbi:MAG TPA: hypothetical protein VGG73_03715 [Vicinamibacterales bacterium]|jgi:hypothetical protein